MVLSGFPQSLYSPDYTRILPFKSFAVYHLPILSLSPEILIASRSKPQNKSSLSTLSLFCTGLFRAWSDLLTWLPLTLWAARSAVNQHRHCKTCEVLSWKQCGVLSFMSINTKAELLLTLFYLPIKSTGKAKSWICISQEFALVLGFHRR